MQDAIVVQALGKRFSRYRSDRPLTIMEAALSGFRRMRPQAQFWALRDVSFSVAPGKMLGVIGKNGAGKSTLLQLVGGIGRPDAGTIAVRGRIGGLLDLGAGFHTDLTGRENVFIGGVVAGLTRREVAKRFSDIVEFAELEAFIDSPMRTYSTGMQMRLAFSVAVHTEPKVLLIDEYLSVGDVAFQGKCLDRIAQFKAAGCAIMLVSHNPRQIQQLCDQALWLREGRIVVLGDPKIVAGQYDAEMRSETQRRTPERPPQKTRTGLELRVNDNRFGSLEAEITDVRLLPQAELDNGAALCIEMTYESEQPLSAPIFSISITREDGQTCFDTNTEIAKLAVPTLKGKGQMKLYVERLDLVAGKYFVNVGIYEQTWAYAYDFHWHVYPLLIKSSPGEKGVLCPPCRWELDNGKK